MPFAGKVIPASDSVKGLLYGDSVKIYWVYSSYLNEYFNHLYKFKLMIFIFIGKHKNSELGKCNSNSSQRIFNNSLALTHHIAILNQNFGIAVNFCDHHNGRAEIKAAQIFPFVQKNARFHLFEWLY